MRLDRLDHLPSALANITPRQIKDVFPNPALIFLAGTRPEPVFVSTLLHGNETTSFTVLQHLQRVYANTPPPRSLLIFVGNVAAAEQDVRLVDGQPDFNRIWSHGPSPYHALAQDVLKIARQQDLFASIDIHNNTGANPLYGCVNTLRPADLQLATLFAPIGVVYRNPSTTQSIAFSQLCPSITIECGQNGNAEGAAAAIELVEDVLRLEVFASHPPPPNELRLYETIGRVVVHPNHSVSFGGSNADLVFRADLESMNFISLKAGTVWAMRTSGRHLLSVVDEHGTDMTEAFFKESQGVITLARDVTPAMITRDLRVIRQDCLCYLMRPL